MIPTKAPKLYVVAVHLKWIFEDLYNLLVTQRCSDVPGVSGHIEIEHSCLDLW